MSELRKYGWRPSLPDHRDLKYAIPAHIKAQPLPPSIDLTSDCPPVYDQGQLGSCTANAIAGAVQFDEIKQKGYRNVMKPSRLFIYANERELEGTPLSEDSGAYIRDGFKAIATLGICPERYWPYYQERFSVRPSATAYAKATIHKAVNYAAVQQDLYTMKACLAEGYPIVVGFSVYESFESDLVAETGEVPMPDSSEQMLGGHAVVVVGYDDESQRFVCRNSWGKGWGVGGYFTLPYKYLTSPDLASDFWTVRVVT